MRIFNGVKDHFPRSPEHHTPWRILSKAPEAPSDLLFCRVEELLGHFGEPSLIHIGGTAPSALPVLICTLLHGDEHSGFLALQRFLLHLSTDRGASDLPRRPVILLLGNLLAAQANQRFLLGQCDFNRIWDRCHSDSESTPSGSGTERRWALATMDLLFQHPLFAAIDLHNNTGKNPCYSCVANLKPESLQLAQLFSPHVMFFEHPSSTFGFAFADHTPTVTLEAGTSGCPDGIERICTMLGDVLHIGTKPHNPESLEGFQLYRNRFRITVQPHWDLCMVPALRLHEGPEPAVGEIWLRDDIDIFNFVEIEVPTLIGRAGHPLKSTAGSSTDVPIGVEDHGPDPRFSVSNSGSKAPGKTHPGPIIWGADRSLYFAPGWIPSMLTPHPAAIRSDCIGYLMEKR